MESTEKGIILFIDKSQKFLDSLDAIFNKAYDVKLLQTAKEALAGIRKGYSPAVIFCSQNLEGMKMSECVKESALLSPDSVIVLLADGSDNKEIINSIRNGYAFMYAKRDADNLELFQSAYLAFEWYKLKMERRKLIDDNSGKANEIQKRLDEAKKKIDELNSRINDANNENQNLNRDVQKINIENENLNKMLAEVRNENDGLQKDLEGITQQNTKLEKLLEESQIYPNQSIMALADLIAENEIFYFTSHTKNVVDICKGIAEDIGLDSDRSSRLFLASMLHNIVIFGMPDELQLVDPVEADLDTRKMYFSHFNRSLNILAKIKLLEPQIKIISKIWEHHDGTGYPRGISGDSVDIEAQIIALANIYHNLVYRVRPEQYEGLKESGKIQQVIPDTIERHKAVVKYFFKNTKWFGPDIVRSFQDLAKHKEMPSLTPANEILTIDLRRYFGLDIAEDENDSAGTNSEANNIADVPAADEESMEIARIDADKAREGMIAVHDVITVSGIKVVNAGAKIDKSLAKTLRQLVSDNMINEKILVKVPQLL